MRTTRLSSVDITDLAPEELILSILHFSNGVIPGALYLQKLVFLAVHEDKKRRAELEKAIEFRPLNFGPYSDSVRSAIDRLESDGLVISRRQVVSKYNREVFALTSTGRQRGDEIANALNKEAREFLRNLCLAAKQLGYSGILRYVYTKYPELTSRSKIKEEVFKSYDY
jgi:uncharacterized protein YwgA